MKFEGLICPKCSNSIPEEHLEIKLTCLTCGVNLKDLIFTGNFAWYNSTTYYNELTKKEEPINAPKFKWNFGLQYNSLLGDIAFNYRHVDQFEWKDGLWAGIIGPYNIFDCHYNYSINEKLQLSVSALNMFNDIHRELVGGAKMGRQVVFRLTTSL